MHASSQKIYNYINYTYIYIEREREERLLYLIKYVRVGNFSGHPMSYADVMVYRNKQKNYTKWLIQNTMWQHHLVKQSREAFVIYNGLKKTNNEELEK